MAQVPVVVAAQVKSETQKLAQEAKIFSKLTNFQIEERLLEFKLDNGKRVVADEGGSHFSELASGKKSKAHQLVYFREALEKTGLIPPVLKSNDGHAKITARVESADAVKSRTDTRDSRQRVEIVCDWKEETAKITAFNKAKNNAAAALRRLAEVMDSPTQQEMSFDDLNNFYREKIQEHKDSLQSLRDCIGIGQPTTGDQLQKLISGTFINPAEQVQQLAEMVVELKIHASSGWDYSTPIPKTGAKVVQLKAKDAGKRSVMKKAKKTKSR
jgi:hypothetical protein